MANPKLSHSAPWTFVSIPDFLNFDIEYPQKGWEDALGFILDSMKKKDPAFAMVAGDLVMGHWGTKKGEIDEWADKYYPGWVQVDLRSSLQCRRGRNRIVYTRPCFLFLCLCRR